MADLENAFIEAAQANNVSELQRLIAAGVDKDNAVDEYVCFIYCSVTLCARGLN
jgi:hypothetical protein